VQRWWFENQGAQKLSMLQLKADLSENPPKAVKDHLFLAVHFESGL